ncbi:MAG TPA: family 16 glycoside hydrolase [Ktedonobacteraceae bacterium]|nr:family 16 glycoside hydrolase [Ktedonobacteraceae bacterium]
MTDEKKRHPKPLRLLPAVICLLLLLTGSSIFLLVHARSNEGNISQAARSTPTHSPISPTTAPSPTATATTSAASAITNEATATPTPLFSDDFVDNTKGWYISNVAGYTRMLMVSGLELTDTNHKSLIESLPTTHSFDDFSLITTLTLEQGDKNDSVGVYLRGDSNLDHDYRINIFGDNTYSISKEYLDTNNAPQSLYLVPPTHLPQLKPLGAPNKVTIIMQGSIMQLLINDTYVNTLSDPDYTKGQIALFVTNGTTSQGVTAIFSSIEITPTPEQLPGS